MRKVAKELVPLFLLLCGITGQAALPATVEAVAADERLEGWARDEERLRKAYSDSLGAIDAPAHGIVVPVEAYPDGSAKISATAGKAQFFSDSGLVWCGDVTVREFERDGSVKAAFKADGCIVDRKTRSGWLEGRARGEMDGTVISGVGIYVSFPDEYVRVSSDVEIVSEKFKFEGVKL
ncbi:MAG: hypothetical protein K6F50_07325 [Kiritimatiellae bacterium]|nr:hypothetical protein [Kiritimatiellia bacterium]